MTHTIEEKNAARKAMATALRLGHLTRSLKCERCKKKARTQGHHDDYSMPLDVRWLCRPCHDLEHGGVEVSERQKQAIRAALKSPTPTTVAGIARVAGLPTRVVRTIAIRERLIPTENIRTVSINVWLRADEYEKFSVAAAAVGLSVGGWLRALGLEKMKRDGAIP